MLHRLLMACGALALLHTQALADSRYLGTINMYLCDGGEDLCSNTLTSAPINLPPGPFTEDFVFDFANDFHDYPDDVPLLQASVLFETFSQADFNAPNIQLYNSSGTPFGFEIQPFVLGGSVYSARTGGLIYPGAGYYVEVTGVSNIGGLPLQVSVNAFDLGGPGGLPEPSTWAMMLIGVAGLGFAARRRRTSALVPQKRGAAQPGRFP